MDQRTNNFWEATYRRNIAKMIGVCCRYTQNRQTAEDLAHDAFIVAINKVSGFENKGPFDAWLRRIVVNVALQYLREQKKLGKFEKVVPYAAFDDYVQEEIPVNEHLTFSESELLEVISYLPDHHRLVFNLYVIDNLSHAQISAQLGISEGTSKSHLARARKKIRELLNDQLNQNKERKRGFLFLLFPYKLWNIDHLFVVTLNDFSVQPEQQLSFNQLNLHDVPIPKFKPAGISNSIYLKTGIWGIASVAIVAGISNWHLHSDKRSIDPMLLDSIHLVSDSAFHSVAKREDINSFLFSDSNTATISDNPIMVEKTKHSEPMKNLSTLGGILMASLTFDSSALIPELPVQFKNQTQAANRILEPAGTVEMKPVAEQKSTLLSGTFYASELLWSDERYKLFLFGKDVKVDLNTQKFTGNGKFSFLDGVKYVIVEGIPMKLNERIKLSAKKYYLEQLNASDGTKKYGENGKEGVVEITLAE